MVLLLAPFLKEQEIQIRKIFWIVISFYRCSWRHNDSGWRPRISSRRAHRFWRIFEIRNQGICWKKCPSFTIWRKFRSKKWWISVNDIDFALLRNCFLKTLKTVNEWFNCSLKKPYMPTLAFDYLLIRRLNHKYLLIRLTANSI